MRMECIWANELHPKHPNMSLPLSLLWTWITETAQRTQVFATYSSWTVQRSQWQEARTKFNSTIPSGSATTFWWEPKLNTQVSQVLFACHKPGGSWFIHLIRSLKQQTKDPCGLLIPASRSLWPVKGKRTRKVNYDHGDDCGAGTCWPSATVSATLADHHWSQGSTWSGTWGSSNGQSI